MTDTWKDDYATGWIKSINFNTTVHLHAGGHLGEGGSWGIGLGAGYLEGNLGHYSWSRLCSAEKTGFYVGSVSDDVRLEFTDSGGIAALFAGGNLNDLLPLSAVGFSGSMNWSLES